MRSVWGVLLLLLAAAVCCSFLPDIPKREAYFFSAGGRPGILEYSRETKGTVRVNTADAEELTQLPGIGDILAQAIINEREIHGLFRYPEDLMAVSGIGKQKLQNIRPWLDLTEGE